MRKIFIVDDHPIMRYGLTALIQVEPDLMVSGEAGTAREAQELLARELPDLLVADISLPDKHGLEFVKDLRALHPDLLILVVSMHPEKLYAERALRAGAKGYVMKDEAPGNLVNAIRQVLSGGVFVSEAISSRILQSFAGGSHRKGPAVEALTDRELEVFRLIGEGRTGKDIASVLTISPRTVDAHRAHIKEKLGLRDGNDLVHKAVRWVETGELC